MASTTSQMLFLILVLLYAQKGVFLSISNAYFKRSIPGHRLNLPVISEHHTSNFLECCLYCQRKPTECKSINYKRKESQVDPINCQLLNSTKATHAQNMLPDVSYDNYELLLLEKEDNEKQEKIFSYAKTCNDLYKEGKTTSGVYTIKPDDKEAFDVRCDMDTTPGHGWTVFQRRFDDSVSFYRNWVEYKTGFGNLSGQFWLGLDKIHRLTSIGKNILRVDLESFHNEFVYAVYASFSVGSESENYKMNIGGYSGTAGDSLGGHNGAKFSTPDRDNDGVSRHCGKEWSGGWWFINCFQSFLNSIYRWPNANRFRGGLHWFTFTGNYNYSKVSLMKCRSEGF